MALPAARGGAHPEDPSTNAADPMDLYRRYHRSREPRLRDAIVDLNVGLVRGLARRFDHRGEELDDLVQVAFWGLLKAIERFDPDQGRRFSTFAVPTIVGELKRHFRDHRWKVRVPRSTQEHYLRVRETVEVLSQVLGHDPSPADIARSAGLSVQEVCRAFQAGNSFRPLSLNDVDDGADAWVERRFARPCQELHSAENRQQVTALLTRLPEREQRIVRLRFGQDLTQREIAERIGISQMHVSRLLNHSLETLRGLAG
jgi:RNA polymerase sigma-B factor